MGNRRASCEFALKHEDDAAWRRRSAKSLDSQLKTCVHAVLGCGVFNCFTCHPSTSQRPSRCGRLAMNGDYFALASSKTWPTYESWAYDKNLVGVK